MRVETSQQLVNSKHFSPGINHRDKNRGDRKSGRRGRLSSDLIVFSLWD